MKSVLGYGSLSIPTDYSGNYEFDIQTSKLVSNRNALCKLIYRMNDYYFGCAVDTFIQIKDNFLSPYHRSTKRSFHLNNQIITEASGQVRLCTCIMSKSGRNKNGNDRRRYMLDEVLSKVRRHKRSLHQENCSTNGVSLNQTTKELLSRVRARKEARNHQIG